jgi:hypothetical protein
MFSTDLELRTTANAHNPVIMTTLTDTGDHPLSDLEGATDSGESLIPGKLRVT